MVDQISRHHTEGGAVSSMALATRWRRGAFRACGWIAGCAVIAGCIGVIAEPPSARGNRGTGAAGGNGGAGASSGTGGSGGITGSGAGGSGVGGSGVGGSGVGGSGVGGSGTGGSGAGGSGTGGSGGTSPPAFVPAPATLRRLTLDQYANTVRDLLGPNITLPTDLEPDTQLNGLTSIGAARTAFSPRAIEQLETAALALSQQALTDPTMRAALVTCAPSAAVDDACARKVVTSFGRRAWRRPLTPDEVNRYTAIAT